MLLPEALRKAGRVLFALVGDRPDRGAPLLPDPSGFIDKPAVADLLPSSPCCCPCCCGGGCCCCSAGCCLLWSWSRCKPPGCKSRHAPAGAEWLVRGANDECSPWREVDPAGLEA